MHNWQPINVRFAIIFFVCRFALFGRCVGISLPLYALCVNRDKFQHWIEYIQRFHLQKRIYFQFDMSSIYF